jgi:hypothetical protein
MLDWLYGEIDVWFAGCRAHSSKEHLGDDGRDDQCR